MKGALVYNFNMSEEKNDEHKYKILIVDDDDFLVDMYSTKFGISGVDTQVFKSGEQVLDYLRGEGKVDLLLLDIVIPIMSGIEILAEIRKEKLLPNVPVVMLTNQNDEKDISEAKKLGVSGYIVKSSATPSEVVDEVIKIIKNF